jgi:ABC-2 type transport system permease protein
MALKDVYSPTVRMITYAVANQDTGKMAGVLVDRWTKEAGVAQPLPDNWRDELVAGRLQYVLVIEPGFSEQASDMNGKGEAKARLLAEPGMGQAMFEMQRTRLLAMVAQLRAEVLLAQLDLGINVAAMVKQTPVAAERVSVGGARPTAVQQNVPAWLVFGMFFVVASIAGLFVEERACGALSRLRSLGAQPWQLIVSKIVPYVLVNGIQAVLMLAVGVLLMPVIGGDGMSLAGVNWLALIVMLLAISLAAVSLALTVACLVSSHAQAATLGPILNILMAALGGIMVPAFVMPPVMQKIAAFSPMNWGLEGLLDVLLRGGNLASILPEAGRLAGFALLMLMVGFVLFRRRV